MKIIFSKEELLRRLSPAMGTVSTRNTITSIEGVLLTTTKEGTVSMHTYDMNKGVRSELQNVTVIEGGSYIINATRLLQYTKVMPSDEVTLEVDPSLSARIYSGSSSFSLFALEGSDFPSMPQLYSERAFRIRGDLLRKMIGRVIHSVAVQEARPMLCGAYFKIDGNKMEVISCDSYTLSRCSLLCDIEDVGEEKRERFSFIVPGHALNELLKILPEKEESITVYLARKHAIFNLGEMIFFTRNIDSEYIDYERIIPKDQDIFLTVERARLLEGLERAFLIAEEKVQGSGRSHVKLVVSGNMLTLSSSSANGKVYDEMPCTHEGGDLEIGFNCRYLTNSVRAAESDRLYLTLKSPRQSITIEPVDKKEEESFFYMVLPVRMNEG